jgi:hypothetical protein
VNKQEKPRRLGSKGILNMQINTRQQIESTYKAMATKAKYRPAAPSDGMGNITAMLAELNLPKEAAQYAADWWKEEDALTFRVGCCDHPTRPATIFAIEAARNMCAGVGGRATALRLLKMAVAELAAITKPKKAAKAGT